MSNIDRMSRSVIKDIGNEMLTAYKKIAKKHGIIVAVAGGRFDEAEATIKFKVTLSSPASGVLTKEQKAYDALSVDSNELPIRGTLLKASNGITYKIVGWRSRAHKYPVVLVDVATNEQFCVDVVFVTDCTQV